MPMTVYHGCIQNELRSLHNRHLVSRVLPSLPTVRAVAKHFHSVRPRQRFCTLTDQEVIRLTPSHRRARVIQALEDFQTRGLMDKDTMVHGFIKHEKAGDDLTDPNEMKDPRLIQFRSFVFTAQFQRVLIPIEHWIFGWCQNFEPSGKKDEQMFAKGMTTRQVGGWVNNQWGKYDLPRADLYDVSRFDAHMNKYVRELIEFSLYTDCNKACSEYVAVMRKNRGVTRGGIKYRTSYTMGSGEACTSLGDSVVMAAVEEYIYREVPHSKIILGDDSVVVCESEFTPNWQIFEECGLPIKYDSAYSIHEVEFCQSRPCRISGVWRMVRNPTRVMSRSTDCIHRFVKHSTYGDWVATVGEGELAVNDGVPVLQEFALYLQKFGKSRETFKQMIIRERHSQDWMTDWKRNRGPQAITAEARADFALAWGIPVDDQQRMEQKMRGCAQYSAGVRVLGCED